MDDDLRPIDQKLLDALWDFSDATASENRFTGALAVVSDDAARAILVTQLARAVGAQDERSDEAFALLDSLDSSGSPSIAARVLLERGRLTAYTGQVDEAVPLLTNAVREAAAAGETFLVLDALHLLAVVDEGHEEEWAGEGFALLDGLTDTRLLRWGVAVNNNLAWTFMNREQPAEALTYFEAARDVAERHGTTEQKRVARWAIARCLRELGRTDEALAIQNDLARLDPADPYVIEELEVLTGVSPAASE
ncbi:tetratricopeptide repeat protein [Agromyces atrinae]|uniref:Tetratricopeptide (TPR) repeat protein n=1 Tax=Agromyces atrinae TaxID=592376 RepID=A0A4Q2M8U7_9MICO|nr:tetratricopeptide repeat protein [Agromyces atrinae]NYD65715.1 tetratricopeptide (TPR) repeat protein [Agromyces atrinae]RXZ85510.1 tetratricopeptide repeat protein [Agromyces atrinae]